MRLKRLSCSLSQSIDCSNNTFMFAACFIHDLRNNKCAKNQTHLGKSRLFLDNLKMIANSKPISYTKSLRTKKTFLALENISRWLCCIWTVTPKDLKQRTKYIHVSCYSATPPKELRTISLVVFCYLHNPQQHLLTHVVLLETSTKLSALCNLCI